MTSKENKAIFGYFTGFPEVTRRAGLDIVSCLYKREIFDKNGDYCGDGVFGSAEILTGKSGRINEKSRYISEDEWNNLIRMAKNKVTELDIERKDA